MNQRRTIGQVRKNEHKTAAADGSENRCRLNTKGGDNMTKRKRLPAGFTERPDGRLQYRVTIGGTRRSIYGATVKECQEKSDELRDRIRKGLLTTRQNMTLNTYYIEWQGRRKGQVKPSTIYANDRRFSQISAVIGNKKLKDITRPDVYRLQAELLKKDLSSTGTNTAISLLRQILESAVNDRIIPYNPTSGVKAVKKTKEEREKNTHRYLNAAELTSFFRQAKGSTYYNLFYFLLITGMRCGEAGALTWEDIDTAAGVIHITKSVTRIDNKTYEIGSTKTPDSVRDIELTPEIKAVIERQKQQQAALFGFRALQDQRQVFTTTQGGLITQSNTCPTIANICRKTREPEKTKKAKKTEKAKETEKAEPVTPVEYFTPHAFRHTFITYEIEKGVPLNDIARQVGHSNTLTLQKYYSHEDPEKVREAFRMISADMEKLVMIS